MTESSTLFAHLARITLNPTFNLQLHDGYTKRVLRQPPDAKPRKDQVDSDGLPASEVAVNAPALGDTLDAGRTPLLDIPELSDHFRVRRLLIKDESANPFGTHKDRKSEYMVRRACALSNGRRPDALCILTAGNAGLSLAGFASRAGLAVVAIVDSRASNVCQLERICREVKRVDLKVKMWSSKDLRTFAGESRGRRVFDCTNQLEPYKNIADELAPLNADYIVLPVGGGELFLGIAKRLRELKSQTKLIGVTVENPDYAADKLYAKWTPHRGPLIKLTKDPSHHRLCYVRDEFSLAETYRTVRRHLSCEPSSATAFDILNQLSFDSSDTVVVINTGTFVKRPETDITAAPN